MSRSFLLILPFLLVLIGCRSDSQKERVIQGKVQGAEGEWVRFLEMRGQNLRTIDSAMIDENGEFQMPNHARQKDYYFLGFQGQDRLILITDSTERVHVQTTREPIDADVTVEGSEETRLLYQYFDSLRPVRSRIDSLQQALRSGQASPSVQKEMQEEQKRMMELTRDFVRENEGSPATILASMTGLHPQKDKELIEQVAESTSESYGNTNLHRQLQRRVRQMEKRAQQQKQREKIEEQRSKLLKEGKKAPDIELETPNGGKKALSDLRGKVVLIDFWASWCKPCIKELPKLKEVYNKYNGKGFEIYGVSLDKERSSWTNAIEKYDMDWVHVSDLKFWNSKAAEKYQVKSIPFTVLVDEKGNVIARNLRAHQLEERLKKVLS